MRVSHLAECSQLSLPKFSKLLPKPVLGASCLLLPGVSHTSSWGGGLVASQAIHKPVFTTPTPPPRGICLMEIFKACWVKVPSSRKPPLDSPGSPCPVVSRPPPPSPADGLGPGSGSECLTLLPTSPSWGWALSRSPVSSSTRMGYRISTYLNSACCV